MELVRELNESIKVTSSKDVYNYLKEFKNQDREMFIVIGLNTKNQPVYREIVAIGDLNSAIVHPRETFKKAIMMSCSSIIIAHNHPSGDLEPSQEDKEITTKFKKAGELLDIKILDHLIISNKGFYSFEDSSEDWI